MGTLSDGRRTPAAARSLGAICVVVAVLVVGACERSGPNVGRTTPTLSSGVATGPGISEPGSESVPTGPMTSESVTSLVPAPTSVPGSEEWYSLQLEGFEPGPVVETVCCPNYPDAGPASLVVWVHEGGDAVQILLLEADPDPILTQEWPFQIKYTRIVGDGERWDFQAIGMGVEERQRLADLVYFDDDEGFVLPDAAFAVASEGRSGVGALLTQVYAGDSQRVTVSVGDYRGQLGALINSQTVATRTIVGHAGFEAVGLPNAYGISDIRFVWPMDGGRWASVHTASGSLAAPTGAALAEAIVADGVPAVSPPIATVGQGQQYVGDVLVSETPEHGPMIAMAVEGPFRAGGDAPIADWDWGLVPDSFSGAGFSWGGPWRVVGTWDGTSFKLTQPPVPVPPAQYDPSSQPTEGCDGDRFLPMLEQISALSQRMPRARQFYPNVLSWDGLCGLVITTFVDSDELRDRLAPFEAEIVKYEFAVQPIG